MSNTDLKRLLNILSALVNKADGYPIQAWRGSRRREEMWPYWYVGQYRLRIRLSEATQRASPHRGFLRGLVNEINKLYCPKSPRGRYV